jgi:gluconolactonase
MAASASPVLLLAAFAAAFTLLSDAQPVRIPDIGAGEGPVWDGEEYLYFTGNNRISRRHTSGRVEVFREPSGANGLLFDREGRLIACERDNRRVTRTERDGAITVLADSYGGMRFNSPNDLTMDSAGRTYFSDPRYGSREGMEMKDGSGRLVEGVYRIDAPGNVTRVIAHEADRPNGLLVSAGDRYLYVADNNNNTVGGARKLWRFDLQKDGSVRPDSRKLIFDWETGRGPDGLEMDESGNLYVAAGRTKAHPRYETADKYKGGVYVLSPDGKLVRFIPIPDDEVTNVAFGDPDRKTLFVTAGGSLWRMRVDTPGWIAGTGTPQRTPR